MVRESMMSKLSIAIGDDSEKISGGRRVSDLIDGGLQRRAISI